MRRRASVDENQADIVRVFRSLGCSVRPTHQLGQGFPDLSVARRGRTYLVEVKDSAKVPSKRRLTPDEKTFHESWLAEIAIVETVDDAIRLVARWDKESAEEESFGLIIDRDCKQKPREIKPLIGVRDKHGVMCGRPGKLIDGKIVFKLKPGDVIPSVTPSWEPL